MVFVRRPNDPVRDPVDLSKRVREKYIRNREFINKAADLCNHSNNPHRLTGPMNLVMLTRQFRKINYELVNKTLNETRWILPTRHYNQYYYRQHHDACYDIPNECRFVSLVFSAERARFSGGSIRIRFFKSGYEQIFERIICIPSEIRSKCWEFERPPEAAFVSVSFRLERVKDEYSEPKKTSMVLRSQTKIKTKNPKTGQWSYK